MGLHDRADRESGVSGAALSGSLGPMLERLERRLLLSGVLESPPDLGAPSALASPDLYDAGDSFSWFDPDKVQAGEAWDCYWDIYNGGTSSSGAFRVDFYVSTNDTITPLDYPMGQVWVPSMGAGQTRTAHLALAEFPVTIPAGSSYYVGVIIDSQDSVSETNENNNIGVDYDDYPLAVKTVDLYDRGDGYSHHGGQTWAGKSWACVFDIAAGGTTGAADFSVAFYASVNDNITEADYLLGTVTVPVVGTGSYAEAGLVLPSFPSGIPNGDYYVGAIIDPLNQVTETDETNNVCVDYSHYPLSVIDPPVDLYGSKFLLVQDYLMPGGGVDVDFKITNGEAVTSGPFDVDFYLSWNETISTSDYYLGTHAIGDLPGNSTTGLTKHMTLPTQAQWAYANGLAAEYYIGMIVDANGEVAETDESNNANEARGLDSNDVTVGPPQADLVPGGHEFDDFSPTTVSPGDFWTARMAVRNTGVVDAGGFWVGFYCISPEFYLGGLYVPSLAAGSLQHVALDVPAFPGIPLGDYHVVGVIDIGDDVSEAHEDNNAVAFDESPLTVAYVDLSGSHFSVPGTLCVGQTFDLEFEVRNTESRDAEAFSVDFYISPDSTITPADYPLGEGYLIGGLAGNSTTGTLTTARTLPSPAEWGYPIGVWETYYIGMIVDAGDDVNEMDEANNASTGKGWDYGLTTVTPSLPDLHDDGEALDGYSSATVMPGDPWSAWLDVRNSGTEDAGGFWVRFYCGPPERYLGQVYVPSLAAGSSIDVDLNLAAFPNIPAGNYHVGAVIDADGDVSESDEANNSVTFDEYPLTVVVGPVDLSGSYFNMSGSFCAGATVDLEFEVQNTEAGGTGAFSVNFFISLDRTFAIGDRPLWGDIFPIEGLMGHSTTGRLTATRTLPFEAEWDYANGLPGPYHIGMIVDLYDDAEETDEDNNAGVGFMLDYVSVGLDPEYPDLRAGSSELGGFLPDTVAPGEPWRCFWEIQNDSAVDAGGFNVDFYASDDDVITTGDYPLGSVWLSGLAAGAYEDALLSLAGFPGGIPEGEYYLGVIVDPDNDVWEADEGNNVGVCYDTYPLTVTLPAGPPEISVADSSGDPNDATIEFITPLSQFRDGVADSPLVRPAYPDAKQYLDVTNTGDSPLTISQIRINAPDVTAAIPLADVVLAIGETRRLGLTYAPSQPTVGDPTGQRFDLAAGLVIVSDADNAPDFEVALRGASTFNSDVSYDGMVNLVDLGPLNLNFGRACDDPEYDPTADINGDCIVNLADLGPLNVEFGRQVQVPLVYKQGEVFLVEDFNSEITRTDTGFNALGGNCGTVGFGEGDPISLEGEDGIGGEMDMPRGGASGGSTRLVLADQTLALTVSEAGLFDLAIHYSNVNDDTKPGESVTVTVDGEPVGAFEALDSGDWNTPVTHSLGDPVTVDLGSQVVIAVAGGDAAGMEVDRVTFSPAVAVAGLGEDAAGASDDRASLRLDFDFRTLDPVEPFGGYFTSLFGLTDTKVSLDGGDEPDTTTPFPGYYLDFSDLFRGSLRYADRSVERLQFNVRLTTPQDVTLRVELVQEMDDPTGTQPAPKAVYRVPLTDNAWQAISVDLPSDAGMGDFAVEDGPFDPHRVSLLAFIVERRHEAAGVTNPDAGTLLIDDVALVDTDGLYPDLAAMADSSTGELRPRYREAFLDYVESLSFQYFLDFASTDPNTGGIIQDRSTFADLMSVGGLGFQLTAYVIGAERGWITRADAAGRVQAILDALWNGPQGPQPVGNIGYKGFFYHFLGIDGLRKQNFDFADTPGDESLNTVELSLIDTALALMGVITAQRYFTGEAGLEPQIRQTAEEIYQRVDWHFMLDEDTDQFYLGWKPDETRDDTSGQFGRFLYDDPDGLGQFSSRQDGTDEVPQTLDYYTDEGILAALLAMASTPDIGREVWDALIRDDQGGPFVKTHPGALFTYQFSSVWLDTGALGTDDHPTRPVDFFANTRAAIIATRNYTVSNPTDRATWQDGRGADFFGLTACEGPFDSYFAESAPPAAIAEDGWELAAGGPVSLEAEDGAGGDGTMPRGGASRDYTRLVLDGQTLWLSFDLDHAADFDVAVRYSNENHDLLSGETVTVEIDAQSVGTFEALDTEDWNAFATARFRSDELGPGPHTVALSVTGGDGFGVEIDRVTLTPLRPREAGTVAPYGVGGSLPHLGQQAVDALWAMARYDMNADGSADLLHPRVGFADAFNLNVADAVFGGIAQADAVLRSQGPWANHTGFAIDHGPMLVVIDNFLHEGFVPGLVMSHPDIETALAGLFPQAGAATASQATLPRAAALPECAAADTGPAPPVIPAASPRAALPVDTPGAIDSITVMVDSLDYRANIDSAAAGLGDPVGHVLASP